MKEKWSKSLFITILFLANILVISICFSIYLSIETEKLKEENIELSEIAELSDARAETIHEKNDIIQELKKEIDDLKQENYAAQLYENHACIVSSSGSATKYHRYSCHYVDDFDRFYIFNIENAKHQGYQPCLECNPPQ